MIMKLNRIERWVVNNPLRVLEQRIQIGWLKKTMSLKEGAEILEIGCGRGAGARLIFEAFQPSRLYALDLDSRMVQKARTYLTPEEDKHIMLLVGDALNLPFENGSLDAVFGFGFLHHVVNWRGALSEIARVLRTGGVYFSEELYPACYQNFLTRRMLVHPEEDRFQSHDLREGLKEMNIPIRKALEHPYLGILAVAVKRD